MDSSPTPPQVVVQPVVAQPVVAQPVVSQPVVATPVRRLVATHRWSPAAVAGTLLAIGLVVFGALALIRADVEGSLTEPVVDVADFTHTALLGLVEIATGVVMLFVSLSRDRAAILGASLLLAIGALIAAIEPTVLSMAIERSFAVIVLIAAAVVALLAAISPTVWHSTTTERVEIR